MSVVVYPLVTQYSMTNLFVSVTRSRTHSRFPSSLQSHHALCQTDPIKLQLLRLWEESLYQEFIAARSHGPNGEAREVCDESVAEEGNVF